MARCSVNWLKTRIKLYNDISGDNLKIGSSYGRYEIQKPFKDGIINISPLDTCTCIDTTITTMIRLEEEKKRPK